MMAMSPDDRDWFTHQFNRVEDALSKHVKEDEQRLTALEEWRKSQTADAARRGTWAGILAGGGITAVVEAVRFYFGARQ